MNKEDIRFCPYAPRDLWPHEFDENGRCKCGIQLVLPALAASYVVSGGDPGNEIYVITSKEKITYVRKTQAKKPFLVFMTQARQANFLDRVHSDNMPPGDTVLRVTVEIVICHATYPDGPDGLAYRIQHPNPRLAQETMAEQREYFAGWILEFCAAEFQRVREETLKSRPPQHTDDVYVDGFAQAMKMKLADKRAEGYGGWDKPAECTPEHLAGLFVKHIQKGDPIDLGNFAMMLHFRIGGGEALKAEWARLREEMKDECAKALARSKNALAVLANPKHADDDEEPAGVPIHFRIWVHDNEVLEARAAIAQAEAALRSQGQEGTK